MERLSPVALLEEARTAGLSVRVNGERLVVRGTRDLEDLAIQLLERKAEVLAALASDAERAIAARIEALRPLVPLSGPIPFLVVRRSEPRPGQCLSCGEPIGPDDYFRCGVCVEAIRRVLREVDAKRRRVSEVAR